MKAVSLRRDFLKEGEGPFPDPVPSFLPSIRGQGGGRGGDTHRLTFPLVSPPPKGHFQTTQ